MKWVMAAAGVCALAAAASSASATDFSFTGNFAFDDDVQVFDFTVGTTSLVTLRTYSYAGGVNAQGQTIAAGGFDPILGVYDSTGLKIAENDDGTCGEVPANSVTGNCFDTFFQQTLAPGSYEVAVSQYNNFGPPNLADAFPHAGDHNFTLTQYGGPGASGRFFDIDGNQMDSHWAFDILNVDSAVAIPPVNSAAPEPASWALMIGGFGLAGASLRARRRAIAA